MGPSVKNHSGHIENIVFQLRNSTKFMKRPMVSTIIDEFGKNSFLILVSCLLSLRTKDTVTLPVCLVLFKTLKKPEDFLNISLKKLESMIYPVGFYRQKAKNIQRISDIILRDFNGTVPNSLELLRSFPGVGLKTANLVLGEGFDIPAICVDIHVHRISNRLGLVQTKTPEETEEALKTIIPKKYWIEYNRLLVTWGQNICTPLSPHCTTCPISELCDRAGVKKYR